MFVLARKRNEQIMFGDDIVVTVCEIKPNGTVRLGIEAPLHVSVYRQEVWQAIQEAKGQDGGTP